MKKAVLTLILLAGFLASWPSTVKAHFFFSFGFGIPRPLFLPNVVAYYPFVPVIIAAPLNDDTKAPTVVPNWWYEENIQSWWYRSLR